MSYLIVDAGNTRIKVFVFEKDKIVLKKIINTIDIEVSFLEVFQKYSISEALLASVGSYKSKIASFLASFCTTIILSEVVKLPFNNLYKTPTSLGEDRIALAAGATALFSNRNVLVIDAGTCITFDFINKNTEYMGGAISPGLHMRYQALNEFTENLPDLRFHEPLGLVGNDTNSSIHSGVVHGLVAEVNGIIELYEEQYSDLTVVLTGGDMIYLSKRLKNSIFAKPNFLAEGLNAILKYQIHE